MTKAKHIKPPFAWLGRFWVPVALTLIMAVVASFRLYQLNTLPPGLDEASARVGLEGLRLGASHWLPALTAANGYSPLWVWLQGLSVQVFGHTALALRLWPALLGTLAVLVTWVWLRDWFNRRIAWIGAFALAVSPWAVTVSRSGLESALPPLLVPLTLWLCWRVLRRASTGRYVALAAVLAADLLSGPIGWLLAVAVLIIGIWKFASERRLFSFSRPQIIGAAILTLGVAVLGYLIGTSLPAIKAMPQALGIATTLGQFGHNIVKVLLMFNVHGDENYRHNLAGEPMLNAFIGLMAIAGLLVSISRFTALRYRALLILTLVMIAPAAFSTNGVPNSSWAVGALPLIFALAAIGTSYMLELWYATFPINSAARASGQAAIIMLLALSMLHGYTQYFQAWAASTPVYLAHNEGSVQIAQHLRTDTFNGDRYAIAPSDQAPVIEYLDYGLTTFRILTPETLAGLPIAAASRQFYIAAASRDETVKTLKSKFPGGVLRPHYSSFNQVEIYYTYETVK
jgi:4-amino-4-deoxy-L-arabinose transferase-like glycosyltransferase